MVSDGVAARKGVIVSERVIVSEGVAARKGEIMSAGMDIIAAERVAA
jgi:hypothetical protein